MISLKRQVDAIVIGSGAGGAPVATELAIAGLKVLVLEAGGPAPLVQPDENMTRSFMRVQKQKSGKLAVAKGKTSFPIFYGSCEGGSTALNAGSAFRLPNFLMNRWQNFGLPDLSDYFNRVDEFLQVTPTEPQYYGKAGEKMLLGIEKLGWKGGPVPRNAPGCTGKAICVLGCPEKAKRATHISYLPVAKEHGAEIMLNTQVKKILLKGKRAIGVEAVNEKGETLTFMADHVILSAGAIYSPVLLQRSGIKAQGIGEHFMLHPGCAVGAQFDEVIHTGQAAVPQSTYSDEFLESEGIMLLLGEIPSQLLLPALMSTASLGAMFGFKNTGLWGALTRDGDKSEGGYGKITLNKKGAVNINYELGAAELKMIRQAYIRSAELAFASGAEHVIPFFPAAFKRHKNMNSFERALPKKISGRRIVGGSLHPMGSCGIARACEPNGQVRGYENLLISDASLFPTSIGVNPQFTIMALATFVASELLASL